MKPPVEEQSGDTTWRFIEREKHHARSYGNPAEYATPRTIESLVRETGQNSLDAAVKPGTPVMLRYRLIELPAGSLRRERFMKSMRFNSALRPHLEGVANTPKSQASARIRRALAELDRPKAILRLLSIEDYGCLGLGGSDFGPTGNFCALIRDVENSNKTEATSGGSYGLGAKTLWSCSELLTVIFASQVFGEDLSIARFIGKAELGWHEVPKGAEHGFVGPGFLGKKYGRDGAESLLLKEDSAMLTDLCLSRVVPQGATAKSGTSALIVGFSDPKSEEDDPASILTSLERAVARNFWPAIVRGHLRVILQHEHGDQPRPLSTTEVVPDRIVPSFMDAYRKHLNSQVKERLDDPGDVVSVPVRQSVPATRGGGGVEPQHNELFAEARLVIRLADAGSADSDLIDSVALARGRAMVTRYLSKRGVVIGARPFHAFLLAGTLAGADGANQQAAEVFLRNAEPPSHETWELWSGLKARYEHGAGKKLDEFMSAIAQALIAQVGAMPKPSEDGPEILQRLIRIPHVTTGRKAKWKLLQPHVRIIDGLYEFDAIVEVDSLRSAAIYPKVSLAGESGAPILLQLERLTSDRGNVEGVKIVLAAGTRRVRLSGLARPPYSHLDLRTFAVKIAIGFSPGDGEGV
jgi:RNA polymerase primary sigma factor